MTLREHFGERAADYNATVFDNGQHSRARRGEIFDIPETAPDLVYLDPPYAFP